MAFVSWVIEIGYFEIEEHTIHIYLELRIFGDPFMI